MTRRDPQAPRDRRGVGGRDGRGVEYKVCSKCQAYPNPIDMVAHLNNWRNFKKCPSYSYIYPHKKSNTSPEFKRTWAERVKECPHFKVSQVGANKP